MTNQIKISDRPALSDPEPRRNAWFRGVEGLPATSDERRATSHYTPGRATEAFISIVNGWIAQEVTGHGAGPEQIKPEEPGKKEQAAGYISAGKALEKTGASGKAIEAYGKAVEVCRQAVKGSLTWDEKIEWLRWERTLLTKQADLSVGDSTRQSDFREDAAFVSEEIKSLERAIEGRFHISDTYLTWVIRDIITEGKETAIKEFIRIAKGIGFNTEEFDVAQLNKIIYKLKEKHMVTLGDIHKEDIDRLSRRLQYYEQTPRGGMTKPKGRENGKTFMRGGK